MNEDTLLLDLESVLGGPTGQELRRRLVRSVARLISDQEEAEDIVQEAMLRLIGRGVDLSRPVGPWLLVVARRLALDRLKSRRLHGPVEELPDPAPLPDARQASRARLSEAIHKLGALSEDQRAVLLARESMGEEVGDIAQRTGMSSGAVRMSHLRARRSLSEAGAGDAGWVEGLGQGDGLEPVTRDVLWAAVLADEPSRFVVRWRRGQHLSRHDRLAEAQAEIERALADGASDPELSGDIHLSLGVLRSSQGALAQAKEALDLAASSMRRRRKRGLLAGTLAHRGWVQAEQGDFAQGELDLREALSLSKSPGEEHLARHHLSVLAMNAGRAGESAVLAAEALALAQSMGYSRGEGSALAGLGLAACERGELEEGVRLLETALALLADERHQGAAARGNYGVILHRCGRLSEAVEQQLRALAVFREVGDQRSIAIAWANLGVVDLERGRVSAARYALKGAAAGARRTGIERLWRFAAAHLAASWEPAIARPLLADVASSLGDDPRLAAMIDVLSGEVPPPPPGGPGFSETVIAGRLVAARALQVSSR